MLGFADRFRSVRAPNPPRFAGSSRFGGPKQVRFFLDGKGYKSDRLQDWYEKNQKDPYISVYDYYDKQFNKALNVSLPLIDIGTAQKPIFVPAELCRIKPGQLAASNLDSTTSSAMIKFACKGPQYNRGSTEGAAHQVLHLDNNSTLQNFGLEVATGLKHVQGRLLRPPQVQYGNISSGKGAPEQLGGGGWYRSSKGYGVGKVVKQSKEPIEWMFIHFHQSEPTEAVMRTLVDGMVEFTTHLEKEMGLNIGTEPKAHIRAVGSSENEQIKNLRMKLEKPRQPLSKYFFVILPAKSIALFRAIKHMGDVQFGFQTVKEDKAARNPDRELAVWDGLGLKLNLKAGGVNHQLTGKNVPSLIKNSKTMFVGYDVTHPTNFDRDNKKTSESQGPQGETRKDAANKTENSKPEKRLPPSQIALVASVDEHLGQWPVVTWTNEGKKEILGDELYKHFSSRLVLYYNRNEKTLPESIVIYRDGVSEGQFEQVTGIELPQIKNACADICKTYEKEPIAVTLVVAVKRHQTRFYPNDKSFADKNGNPKPGTIVDNTVTVTSHWDFYLQPHVAIQGTARPAHYTVLHDEIFVAKYKEKAADQLEQVTHCISYAFGRATKAVSLCTPAYYADMACSRARDHMWELYSGEPGTQFDEKEVTKRSVHDNLKDTMYYI
ncbi:piwi domain-containing protein [Apiospora rasikravindrae]|uniref:Piwi domain-containing protein n=1 Tax=Apiospora rasikravindrae TaxID=990691 RepID=A0ABR1SJ20_9PEZI